MPNTESSYSSYARRPKHLSINTRVYRTDSQIQHEESIEEAMPRDKSGFFNIEEPRVLGRPQAAAEARPKNAIGCSAA